MSSEFSAAVARASVARSNRINEATRIIGAAFGLRARPAPAVAEAATRPPMLTPPATKSATDVPGEDATRRAANGRGPRAGASGDVAKVVGPASGASPSGAPAGGGRRAGRGLGEAVRLLRQGRHAFWPGLVGDTPGTAGPPVVEGARFEARRFTSAQGGRDYRLYVPSPGAGVPRGLILMLHGCKQNPEDFALGTGMNDQAEAEGLVLIYPRQTACQNASCCWNWFRAADQSRDRGEPAILAGMVAEVAAEFGIPPEQCFVAGLSAGGSMAAVLSEVYPDVFAAAGIHSGVPTGAASDVVSAFAAMRGDAAPERVAAIGRRIVFHGVEDRTVHPLNAARLIPDDLGTADRKVGQTQGGRIYQRMTRPGADGRPRSELWLVEEGGHAWSGGAAGGSYTDPAGPDASAEMVRFFLGRD